jgi:hypothetical protein
MAFCLNAQYTITSSSAPVAGDVHSTTDTYSTGLNIPATGVNKLWDYSNLSLDTSGTYSATYTPVSSVPNASLFSTATIAADNGQGNYEMYSVTSNSIGYVGSAAATASDCSVFSNSILFMTYPFAYGNSFFDNFAVSNSQYSMTGTLSTIADGTGTLALPGYTFTNVLKTSMSYTQNVLFGTTNIIVKAVNHNFYSSASKFELFSVTTQTTATGTSTVPYMYGQLNQQFVTGLKEYATNNLFEIFPNPVTGKTLSIRFNAWHNEGLVSATDVSGRILLSEKLNTINTADNTCKIDIASLPPGIYIIRVNAGQEVQTRKLVIQ